MTFSEIKNRAILAIPTLVRGVNFVATMNVFIDSIQSQFWDFSNTIRVGLFKNGQVLNLEKSLNDRFDPVLRRIYVDDDTDAGIVPCVLFNVVEVNPSTVVCNRGENSELWVVYNLSDVANVDFVICSPVEIADVQIRDLINRVPIGQRKYKINLI
jgi:hypothetical protein